MKLPVLAPQTDSGSPGAFHPELLAIVYTSAPLRFALSSSLSGVIEGAKARRRRAGAKNKLLRLGGAAEVLTLSCPVSCGKAAVEGLELL